MQNSKNIQRCFTIQFFLKSSNNFPIIISPFLRMLLFFNIKLSTLEKIFSFLSNFVLTDVYCMVVSNFKVEK